MYKHILIPTDGSALSRRAALAGVRLARALGAKVTGLFAAPAATPLVYRDSLPVGYGTTRRNAALIQRAARRHLGVVARAAKAAGVRCETVSVIDDYPADAIVAQANKRRCDLIFMASHGRHGLRGALLGSETQKVLARASLPVLVYRPGQAKRGVPVS
jgi:nucleotide-binding universal stress UspA family protein